MTSGQDQATEEMPSHSPSQKSHCHVCLISFGQKREASQLCFDCEEYLCGLCSQNHTSHTVLYSNITNQESVFQKLLDNLQRETDKGKKLKDAKIVKSGMFVLQHEKEEMIPLVTGMCVLDTNIVLVDNHNHCLKFFDLQSCEMVRYIKFDSDSKPWSIATIPQSSSFYTGVANSPGNSIVVTFPDTREISIIAMDMWPVDVLRTHLALDKCYDIMFFKDQYVTLCYQDIGRYYLYFLNVSGMIGKIIKLHNDRDQPLTGRGVYFTLHPKLDIIYVSSAERKTVTSIDYEGRVLKTFRLESYIEEPKSICTDENGNIFVCSYTLVRSKVNQLSADLDMIKSHDVEKKEPDINYAERLISHRNKLFYTLGTRDYTYFMSEYLVD